MEAMTITTEAEATADVQKMGKVARKILEKMDIEYTMTRVVKRNSK